MQGLWKLLIPLGLGTAAALLNYMGRASDIEAVSFVGLKKDLRIGEEITPGHLVRIDVPKNMSTSMAKSAIPYSQWAVLYGRRGRRALSKGDLFLWSDLAPKSPWGKDEVLLQIPLEGISLPKELEVGQKVVFLLPENLAELGLGKDPKGKPPEKETKGYKPIGPFRVYSIGINVEAGGTPLDRTTGTNVISLVVPAPKKGTDFDDVDTHRLLTAVFRPSTGPRRGAFFLYLPENLDAPEAKEDPKITK